MLADEDKRAGLNPPSTLADGGPIVSAARRAALASAAVALEVLSKSHATANYSQQAHDEAR
jgi:hypothetical protein